MGTHATKWLNLIDIMVLVAATAAGLAASRLDGLGTSRREYLLLCVIAMAVMWTAAIFVLNLTRHRTELRALACRPGFSAVAAVMVERATNCFYTFMHEIGTKATPYYTPPASLTEWIWFLFNDTFWDGVVECSPAGAVSAVWLVTAMAGCWRAEKTWIDRTGRALGVFWILVTVMDRVSYWIFGT